MKTKGGLKKLIRECKIWMEHSERHFGRSSAQHKEATAAFWEAQKELGAIELAELEKKPTTNTKGQTQQ